MYLTRPPTKAPDRPIRIEVALTPKELADLRAMMLEHDLHSEAAMIRLALSLLPRNE